MTENGGGKIKGLENKLLMRLMPILLSKNLDLMFHDIDGVVKFRITLFDFLSR